VGVAELDRLERTGGLYPQYGDVGLLVSADELRRQLPAIGEIGDDLVSFRYHVVVGHDNAGLVDDETRAERIDPARPVVSPFLVLSLIEELLEELLEWRTRRHLRHRNAPRAGHAL